MKRRRYPKLSRILVPLTAGAGGAAAVILALPFAQDWACQYLRDHPECETWNQDRYNRAVARCQERGL